MNNIHIVIHIKEMCRFYFWLRCSCTHHVLSQREEFSRSFWMGTNLTSHGISIGVFILTSVESVSCVTIL